MSQAHAFKTRVFNRWAQGVGLTDTMLGKAVDEMAAGMIDADLGGGVVKKRVALPGRGKRGGARTIVATNQHGRWFFLLGYEKNALDNIDNKTLRTLQDVAADLLALDDDMIAQVIGAGKLHEVTP